jgi:hypothetical protein
VLSQIPARRSTKRKLDLDMGEDDEVHGDEKNTLVRTQQVRYAVTFFVDMYAKPLMFSVVQEEVLEVLEPQAEAEVPDSAEEPGTARKVSICTA